MDYGLLSLAHRIEPNLRVLICRFAGSQDGMGRAKHMLQCCLQGTETCRMPSQRDMLTV